MTAIQVKKLMPAGSTTNEFTGRVEWRKRGGFADAQVKRVLEKAKALGFAPEVRTDLSSPDGNVVGGGTRYVNADKDVLVVSTSYGASSRENRFSITLVPARG